MEGLERYDFRPCFLFSRYLDIVIVVSKIPESKVGKQRHVNHCHDGNEGVTEEGVEGRRKK